jgi:hypothetical protein
MSDKGFDLLVEEAMEQPDINRGRKQAMLAAFKRGLLGDLE